MDTQGLFQRAKDFLNVLTGANRFDRFDFGVLKAMLVLAAVDGEVSADEVARFQDVAAKCRGCEGESFDVLWDSALRSAGYILLQSKLLGEAELVAAFVREVEKDFVGEVALEPTEGRERAFVFLDEMASADGICSKIERKCLTALAARVREVRQQAIAERYPRATRFDK